MQLTNWKLFTTIFACLTLLSLFLTIYFSQHLKAISQSLVYSALMMNKYNKSFYQVLEKLLAHGEQCLGETQDFTSKTSHFSI
jgi:hypothetical protein